MKKLKKKDKKDKKVKIKINIQTLAQEEEVIYEYFEKKAKAIADLILDKKVEEIPVKKESQIKSIW